MTHICTVITMTRMKLNRNLKYRAYPTPKQDRILRGWMGTLRWLWNRFLEETRARLGRTAYDRSMSSFRWPNAFDLAKEMTEVQQDSEFAWIQDTPRHARFKTLHDLEVAWSRCFKRLAAAPRYKSRKDESMRIYIPIGGCNRFELLGEYNNRCLVLVAGKGYRRLGALKVIIDRPLQGKVKSWSIIREGTEWYVIACCEIEKDIPVPVNDKSIGIDRGVVNLVADSEGRIVKNPRLREKVEQRIHRLQRKAVKQKRGSKNQRKTYEKANKLRRKAIRRMENLIDTETKRYAENYGTVVIEKLLLPNMTKSAKGTKAKPGKKIKQKAGLNRALSFASPGKIATRLTYKVEERGGKVIEVPAKNTSNTCCKCGYSNPKNRLTQSDFKCLACGYTENADTQAAKNILAKGLAGDVVVKKPRKKVSRPRGRMKKSAVKPTVKQPVLRKERVAKAIAEVSRSKRPVEAGTQVREDLDRGVLDTPLQRSETINAEDTS